jgi:FMN phosphatase YigB (HAD superfamily)
MLRYFATSFTRDDIGIIGFDLDGTLYDEFDFVTQLYSSISKTMSELTNLDDRIIYRVLLEQWLREGNTKELFQNVLEKIGFKGNDDSVVSACISVYRDFSPVLKLSPRMVFILEQLIAYGYSMFLVSDGNDRLQRKKIEALGLYRFFSPENIAITGDYGDEYQKPSTKIVSRIEILCGVTKTQTVLYAGDRERDRLFAEEAGFRFIGMKNAVWVELS